MWLLPLSLLISPTSQCAPRPQHSSTEEANITSFLYIFPFIYFFPVHLEANMYISPFCTNRHVIPHFFHLKYVKLTTYQYTNNFFILHSISIDIWSSITCITQFTELICNYKLVMTECNRLFYMCAEYIHERNPTSKYCLATFSRFC